MTGTFWVLLIASPIIAFVLMALCMLYGTVCGWILETCACARSRPLLADGDRGVSP